MTTSLLTRPLMALADSPLANTAPHERSFQRYAVQVLANARALGIALVKRGITLVTGGTDTPFVVADLRTLRIDGERAARYLDTLGIGANQVPLASDPDDFSLAHGLRLGVSAITTRGMGETQCDEIADIVVAALRVTAADVPATSDSITLSDRVARLCTRFPVNGHGPQ